MHISGHIQTIIPYYLRTKKKVNYNRERINTHDEDFLDLDWIKKGGRDLLIFSHGLEGSSDSKYIVNMIDALYSKDFDFLSWNSRSCSGEMNKLETFYHSGKADDLDIVINHANNTKNYKNIYLLGFSMGGNITLKYLGAYTNNLPQNIKSATVFSVPCDLESSCHSISTGFSKVYGKSFLKTLHWKLLQKKDRLEDRFDFNKIAKFKTLFEFDNVVTGPIHGYKDALDYYNKESSKNFISKIKTKTIIVNAKNDPFLQGDCYPYHITNSTKFVNLITPYFGGHVGFSTKTLVNYFLSNL
jgi:uncharacterized protein